MDDEKTNIFSELKNFWDAYDIFGYIVPAIVFTFLLIPILPRFMNIRNFMEFLSSNSEVIKSINWMVSFFIVSLFIVILYVIGHIIASASSIIFDRMISRHVIGYPYRFFFKAENVTLKDDHPFWCVKPLSETKLEDFPLSDKEDKVLFITTVIGFFFLIFWPHILATILLWPFVGVTIIPIIIIKINRKIRRGIFDREKKAGKHNKRAESSSVITYYRMLGKNARWEKWIDILSNIFVRLEFNFLREWIHLWTPFPPQVQEKFERTFYRKFHLDQIKEAGTENYWFPLILMEKEHPSVCNNIRKFRSLYGFARNLSMAFLLSFIIYLIFPVSIWFKSGTFVLGNIFLLRYIYLFYNYYSKYIFRAFIALEGIDGETKNNK